MKSTSAVFFCTLALLTQIAHGQWQTQEITLRPGWNAIDLRIHPEPSIANDLFSGVAIESAWEWNGKGATVEFIQDPSNLVPQAAEWTTWFSPESGKNFLSDLITIRGGRTYLIHYTGANAFQWHVTGSPAKPEIDWAPDAFTLTGLPVSQSISLEFQEYFASSPAHSPTQIFRLSTSGKWLFTSLSATIQPGVAYWIRTNGASTFAAPMEVKRQQKRGIDFGELLEESEIILRNHRTEPTTLTVTLNASKPAPTSAGTTSAGTIALLYRDYEEAGSIDGDRVQIHPEWQPLRTSLTFTLAGGEDKPLHLAVNRSKQGGNSGAFHGLIEVRDTSGIQEIIPVSVTLGSQTAQQTSANSNLRIASLQSTQTSHAGLWVGTATIDEVNWVGGVPANVIAANPDLVLVDKNTPRPTRSEFQQRIIVHVDATGKAHLLQKVIQVWEEGTTIPDPKNPGLTLVSTPGQYRLFSNEETAASFKGAALRNGISVPRRISTAAYPLKSPLPLSGAFKDGTLTGTIVLGYHDPLNPFRHTFHPQHDNLDARYHSTLPPGVESYSITRNIQFEFQDEHPDRLVRPGWGYSELGGVYRESITGLHKNTLNVKGHFTLRRVSQIPQLN